MIGLLAGRFAFVEYRLMLEFSLRGEPMMAQMTLKNVVLLTAVLILTYGLYVPKSWRRAALVVGPLALLPFATLPVLALRHPAAMAWLGKGWRIEYDPAGPPVHLRRADPAHPGGRRDVRGPHDLPAAPAGRPRPGSSASIASGERLGAGGMGEVYLAEHRLLKRPCAVKLIRPDAVADPSALARFEREVQADRHALAPEHRRDLRLRPDRGRDLLLRHGVPAGPEPGGAGRAPRPPAAGAGGLPAAAGLPGAARGARGGPDPPRHQAVQHHRRASRRAGRRGQAARLRPGPAPGGVAARRT